MIQKGFTLVQLVVGLALIALIGGIAAPNIFKRMPQYERDTFYETLNSLARQTWIRALQTGHVHKITFNLAMRTIQVEEKTDAVDHEDKPLFERVLINVVHSNYQWPDHYEIKQFYVEGVDEVGRHGAEKTMEDIWFFIVPEGMAQEVILNILDTKDTSQNSDGKEFSLVLNPFRVQFEEFMEYQNPATI